MKPDQERVQALLKDTVVLLCKNGLCFDSQLKVQGLLGITLDDGDVFLVQIDETLTNHEDNLLLDSTDHIQSCESDSLKCDGSPFDSTVSRLIEESSPPPRRALPRNRRTKRRLNPPIEVRSTKTSSNDSHIPLESSVVVKSEAAAAVTDSEENSSDRMASSLVELRQSETCSVEIDMLRSLTGVPKLRRAVRRRTVASSRLLVDKLEPGFLDFGAQSFDATIPRDKDEMLSLVDLTEDQFVVGNATYGADCQGVPRFPSSETDGRVGIDDEEFATNKLMISDSDQDLKMDPYGAVIGGEAWPPSTETGSGGGLDRKSFPCEYEGCGLSFYHSYTLYRHQRIKHGRRFGAVDQLSFFCAHPGCGRVFYRELALIKHQRAVHGN